MLEDTKHLNHPARKVTNSGTRKNIGLFSSYKMQTSQWYESLIERDYMYLLECDPDVVRYQSQPLTIVYNLELKQRRYTPDFLVERLKQKQIIEVKPASKVLHEKNQTLWKCVTPIFNSYGWEFIVVTDAMIRVQPLLNNLKLLYKYVTEPLTPQIYIDCHNYFKKQTVISVEDALSQLGNQQFTIKTVFKLILLGVLETDLMKPICLKTQIKISQTQSDILELPI